MHLRHLRHALAYRSRRSLVRDHVVDVVDRDARRIEHLVQQQRGVADRDSLNGPGVGEHPGARVTALRICKAQSAVVGDRGEARL